MITIAERLKQAAWVAQGPTYGLGAVLTAAEAAKIPFQLVPLPPNPNRPRVVDCKAVFLDGSEAR